MTLKTLIEKLRDIALRAPNVRSVIVNDVYRENAFKGIEYGVVAILQDTHTVSENIVRYSLNLIYIDRLTRDASNEVDVQSDGMLTLTNIINTFIGENDNATLDGEVEFTAFNQRFADDCAGVYAAVSIGVESNLGICYL